MLTRIFLLPLVVLVLTLPALAQSQPTLTLPELKLTPTEPPPGKIQLLDGYTHTREQGFDSVVGNISKPGGITIGYDMWGTDGPIPTPESVVCFAKDPCRWLKRQVIDGKEVWIGLTHGGQITAFFPKEWAKFYAQTKSPEDIADFLLIILTYRGK